jgi:hypothetical protein
MNQKLSRPFVDAVIQLLIGQFGVTAVREALKRAVPPNEHAEKNGARRIVIAQGDKAGPPINRMLEQLQQADPEKYRLLSSFYTQLKDREILPEPQDIRQFSQLIGLKRISGKSRKALVPKLMRFLLDQPIGSLRKDAEIARGISEQQRRMGFSLITDKLIGGAREAERMGQIETSGK